ncbi:MAG: class E sortase [Dethiobacter sp.]|jgi:sortase A|nr:class E sortase [Dethiobacter sp.]
MRQGNRLLGTVIIIIGLLLVAMPLSRWGASYYYQYRAMVAWEEQMPAIEAEPLEEPIEGETVPTENKKEIPTGLPDADGMLHIPKIKLSAVVIHGVSEADLKRGPGFYPQSSHPETGNVSIAAHRGVYGSWFRNLDKLKTGDEITLVVGDKFYRYIVRESFITHSRDWSVVESTGKPELTLTTCLFTTNTKRLIVKADLVDTIQTTSQGE